MAVTTTQSKTKCRISEMDCLQWESVVALGLLLTSVFVSIIIILILPDYHQINGKKEVCVHIKDSLTCGKTEDKLHQYLDGVWLNTFCYSEQFIHYAVQPARAFEPSYKHPSQRFTLTCSLKMTTAICGFCRYFGWSPAFNCPQQWPPRDAVYEHRASRWPDTVNPGS